MKYLPATSAYWRKREPSRSRWNEAEYMLAVMADSLRWLVWSKTKDAKRNRNRPKPIPRPGDQDKSRGRFKDTAPRTLDRVKHLLKLPRRKSK